MDSKTAIDKARAILSEEKDGAVWLTLMDVGEYLNFSGIARKYFGRSGNWLLQRLHGYIVNGKPAAFKEAEYAQLTGALRDMAELLNQAADRIDKAQLPPTE